MDALDVLRHETKSAHAWLELNVSDVTPEQAAWRPPGTANSIAATYAHTMISADVDLRRHFYRRKPLIAGEWARRLGLVESFPDDWPDAPIDWPLLREYGREVRAAVEQLVDAVTMADLERTFEMPPSLALWKGYDLHTLHGGRHVWMHGGEIACLKGLQGGEGYRRFLSLVGA